MNEIETWLNHTLGLDPSSFGTDIVTGVIQRRMEAVGITNQSQYLVHLYSSQTERQRLIDEITVPETWFFRDLNPFLFIKDLLSSHSFKTPLRLLSVPCSTGEEPYSLSMLLFEMGYSATQFQIDAVDISVRSLAIAEKAVYTKNSFREEPPFFLDAYIETVGDESRMRPFVCEPVRFTQGNIIDSDFLPGEALYQVILCRNLLIYLDRPARQKTVNALVRLLDQDGLLIVGSVETLEILNTRFEPVRSPSAFAYRKRAASPIPRPRQINIYYKPPKTNPPPALVQTKVIEPNPAPNKALLVTALQLADRGELREAQILCERIVNEQGPNAKAYYLLGLIHESSGSIEAAEEWYNKAIYLEPYHQEALIQLSLLLEKRGAERQAGILRDRAQRAKSEQPASGERV